MRENYAEHIRRLKTVGSRFKQARADRDQAIIAARKSGMPFREIGDAVGLAFNRVRKITLAAEEQGSDE